jgi:MFS family permease
MPAILRFVVLIGVVSLFADMTYEGARGITGPYLATLGASATVVGLVAGSGELIGYAIRLVSGYLADRTGRYWAITLCGYCINLLVVPMLALAGNWHMAAFLIVMERAGKAIRTPSRDAMLSHAVRKMGSGWGFGLHEALDQTGAMTGPLIVAAVLYFGGTYRTGFAILVVPALLAITVLVIARSLYPDPRELETAPPRLETKGFARSYWIYLAGACCVGAGYADFPIIAFHFEKLRVVPEPWIPVFYAVAMGADGLSALVFGHYFDRHGIPVLAISAAIASLFAPLVVLGGFFAALLGVVLWGIGMGAQESIMRAAIAEMTPIDRRGTAYGIFNTGFGLAWFLGSAVMGMIYDWSVAAVIVFSVCLQVAAIPLFWMLARAGRRAA